jgi:beta-galactosidase
MRRVFLFFVWFFYILFGYQPKSYAQIEKDAIPVIGVQVFIEPGQTPEEIDTWFRILKENQMSICRIRMFESYMRISDGSWDFTLFDYAFQAADKYGIKILATLFPFTEKTDIGGFKFPRDETHLQSIAEYIRHLVPHFKQFESLYGWVLINEPGSGSVPDNEFAREKFREWLAENPPKENTDKGYPVLMDLTRQRFLMDYNTWFLNWIAAEIRKYDPDNHLHVNNHAIFSNAAEYDFPSWRKFLNSLGGSAHASWHFGYFNRNQYAVAMSANSEIIQSGAGDIPWIMTEVQGGNNTFSGMAPFCPTAEEIAQWLWVIISTDAKGAIFWTLNPRSSGIEAGEWALLTLQNQPSDRLKAANEVIQTIQKHVELFQKARELNSGIHILYVHEALWAETVMAKPSTPNYEGRNIGAVIKSSLGYFEALCEMGLNCNLKAFDEFDFNQRDYSGQVIILANQLALPTAYVAKLEQFVSRGGKLIVDGLTAFFDENLHHTMKTGFPFEKLFGGNISEFKLVDNFFDMELDGVKIPAHLWRGNIQNEAGKAETVVDDQIYALRHSFGKGEVLWIPSLLGLGSRIANNYQPLCEMLKQEIPLEAFPVRFANHAPGLLMKTMQSGNSLITILINKSGSLRHVPLILKNANLRPTLLFANKGSQISSESIDVIIHSEETLVIEWK